MRVVEPVLFFIVFAFSVTVPTLKQLIFSAFCEREFHSDQNSCLQNKTLNDKIQAMVSKWSYIKSISSLIPTVATPFFFAYFVSYISPTKFFLFPLMGVFLDTFGYVIFSKITILKPFFMIPFSTTFEWFGGMSSTRVIMEYYLLLVNHGSKLIIRFVILGVCSSLGSFLGGTVVTFILSTFGYTTTLMVSLLLLSSALLYTAFLQPIKMKPRPQVPRLTHIKQIASSLKTQLLQRRVDAMLTLVAQFFLSFTLYGTADLKITYYLRSEYRLGQKEIGILQSASAIVEIVGPFICVPLMNRYAKKQMWIFTALVSVVTPVHFIILALAKSSKMLYLATTFMAFAVVYNSFLSSVIKNLFSADNMPFFLGISSSFMLLSILLGASVMNRVYQSTLYTFPGAPFIFSAALNFIGGILATVVVYRNFRVHQNIEEPDEALLLEVQENTE